MPIVQEQATIISNEPVADGLYISPVALTANCNPVPARAIRAHALRRRYRSAVAPPV